MGAEIDRLEVQIEAEATKANSQLDSLTKKLGIVQESLSRLNSGGLTGLSSGVRDFGSAMQSFSAVKAADFTKVASGLTKLEKVPSGSLWNTAYAIGGVAKNLSSLNGVSFDATGLNDLAKALSKFGSKNGTAGAENLGKIKNDLASFVSGLNGVGSVTFDVTGLADLTASIAKLGGEKATQAARNLPAMSVYLKKFVADLNSVGGVTFDLQGLSELVSSIAKLGGKASTQSIKNIPNLAAAISELMATLSQAPTVSKNTIQMVAALGELAAQGAKVGSAAKSVNQSLNSMGNSATGAAKKTKSLASVIGSLYANLFWIKRIAGKVWESMESSMDFLETVNYFEVAMRDIGDSAAAQWKENGYASAEAYASSFSERAKELTEKMTGYSIDVDGNATYSGIKNLGMDPDTVLQYQATFAQVSSSIGVAEESALNFSKALTMLGADWASLRNLTFEQGWEKFASALAGQSRAVRALGIDITNTTLQEYAYKYGLDQAIQEMNQATKAQLRLLAILDQSEVVYGDLANTIESPSNQMRMLQQNVSNLSRVFGNLFLPVLQRTLPYINGVTIALQNLFSWMGNLLGIEFDSINSSMGGMADEMYDLLDGTEDYEDALEGANDAAKKLKNNLQSWHEINNITTNDDSDSSSGTGGSVSGGSALLDSAIADALADYERVWNEAFENMENKAQEYAEKIGTYLQPLKDIIEDFTIGDYFQAGQDTSALVAGIFNFFADAIDDVDWYGIGQNIGDYLAGLDWTEILSAVGRFVWEGLKAALELWAGMFNADPIATALFTIFGTQKLWKLVYGSTLINNLTKVVTKLAGFGDTAIITAQALAGNQNAATALATFYPNLNKKIITVSKGFTSLKKAATSGNFFGELNTAVGKLRNQMSPLQKGVTGVVAVFGEFLLLKDGFYDIVKGSDNLVASIGQIAVGAGMASGALYVAFGPAGLAVAAITGVAAAICGINDAFDEIRAEEIGNSIKNAMSNPGGVPLSEITANFVNAFSKAASGFDIISEKSSELDSVQGNIEDTWLEIYKIQEAMDNGVLAVEEGKQRLETLFSELATLTEQKFSAMNTAILSAYGENGSFRAALESMGVDTEAAIDTMITYGYQNSERAKEIAQELAGLDINSEEYKSLSAELASLTGEMSSFEQATSDFAYDMNALQGQIDYEQIFLSDGSVDIEALKKYLDEAASALEEYKTSVSEAGKELSQYWSEIYNSDNATEEQKVVAQAQLDYIPQAVEAMKSDAELQIVGFTDMLQNDLIERTGQIIDDGVKDWESKNAFEKWWNGIWGAKSEGEYVKEAVDKQKSNIDEVSAAIEESFGNLETNGVIWANDAMDEIYGALINHSYGSGGHAYELNQNFQGIIDGATAGIAELAAKRGEDTVRGYNNGISNNTSLSENESKSWMEKVFDAIHDSIMEFGSPSKAAEQFGLDTVLGFNGGISENAPKTIDIMESYMSAVVHTFNGITGTFTKIGQNLMAGFLDGMSSMEDSLYAKANNIADNIVQTVQNALDIHSPSRVMFALGEYTMEGYQLGLENLYSSVEKSMGGFYHDLQYDVDLTAGLSYKDSYQKKILSGELSNYSNYGIQSDYDTTETNMLLRELLSATRAGHVIECDGRELGRVIQDEDEKFFNRTQRGMFEHR